jgi:hypothetical protein
MLGSVAAMELFGKSCPLDDELDKNLEWMHRWILIKKKHTASNMLLTPIAKCLEAIKAHKSLAGTNITSADIFCSVEDGCG